MQAMAASIWIIVRGMENTIPHMHYGAPCSKLNRINKKIIICGANPPLWVYVLAIPTSFLLPVRMFFNLPSDHVKGPPNFSYVIMCIKMSMHFERRYGYHNKTH